MQQKRDKYECEMCGEEFEFGWSDEEAKQEAIDNGFDINDCGIVCDDCYKLTPWGQQDEAKQSD